MLSEVSLPDVCNYCALCRWHADGIYFLRSQEFVSIDVFSLRLIMPVFLRDDFGGKRTTMKENRFRMQQIEYRFSHYR